MLIGLALGSGSARGWSHIGVINELATIGIKPDIICGTSIGALVGASCLQGNLERLEEWVSSLSRLDVARFLEINASLDGFVDTDKLHGFLNEYVADDEAAIENLDKQFAAVAADLETGREVWLTQGSLIEAVWSSISLPGLFPPTRKDNKWLVDGGLVNPVPVSVCRALGADIVIAVNLNGDIVGRHFPKGKSKLRSDNGFAGKIGTSVRSYAASVFGSDNGRVQPPNVIDSLACSVNITQDRITRSRMAGDPPDILITPRLSRIGLLEFYRAPETIAAGRECVRQVVNDIERILAVDR
jgi:NTE family protein